MKINKIAVITSGGDCQGMNASIYNIVKMAQYHGIEVIGYMEGYKGIINNKFVTLDLDKVANISHLGGTIIKSSRCMEFFEEKYQLQAVDNLKKEKVNALIIIGGDGSYRGSLDLVKRGVKCINLPGTIDNDLFYSELCLGFDTAVNNAVVAIESLKQTLSSHNRCGIIEVMGRDCGDIALECAASTNSDFVVLKEKPTTKKQIVDKVKQCIAKGVESPIVIIAENIFDINELAKKIEKEAKIETKPCQLGRIQRGGAPSVKDRILAMQMGVRAVELIQDGIFNKAIGIKNNRVFEMPIDQALACQSNFDYNLLDLFLKLNG